MPPAKDRQSQGIPHMATRRFAVLWVARLPDREQAQAVLRQCQERGRYLRKMTFFSFQPSGPRYNCGVASTVKTICERQRLSPASQKFTFFRQGALILRTDAPSIVENATWGGAVCQEFEPRCADHSLLHASHSFLGSCWYA